MATLNSSTHKFRPNVAGIIQKSDGRILICERLNMEGAWQFPQGGVDKGEQHQEAFLREMKEEVSLSPEDYSIMAMRGPYRYLFGTGRRKKGFDGQEQYYFHVVLTGDESRINIFTKHQEFKSIRWVFPAEFDLQWLPEFKREVYRAVLFDFFGVVK
jgi:putative (di)nucleoside polyphosphate hydrolase